MDALSESPSAEVIVTNEEVND